MNECAATVRHAQMPYFHLNAFIFNNPPTLLRPYVVLLNAWISCGREHLMELSQLDFNDVQRD